MRHLPALALALATLSACTAGDGRQIGDDEIPSTDDANPPVVVTPDGETMAEGLSLEMMFMEAADEFGVPANVLKAIGWAETQWQMVQGHSEFEGQEPAYGIMGLRGDNLVEGAELAEVSVESAMHDPESNIRAAAALIAEYGAETDATVDAPGSWAHAAVAYSGIEDEEGQSGYVHGEVFRAIKGGVFTETVQIEPMDVQAEFVQMAPNGGPGPDYSDAVWRPSPNHSSRPSGTKGDPQMVIIHTCEGSYSGCWSWLKNSASGVSAHYVVNNTGSEVTQLVKESRKAWHISATYNCSRNSGKECQLNGFGSNNFTIGIEHAGHASQSSWHSGLIDTSAQLSCDITKDNGIPIDKYHIVGHGQLQPWNRVDPGPNWPWGNYISMIDSYCNGGGGGGGNGGGGGDNGGGGGGGGDNGGGSGDLTIVVDSNNSLNGSDAQCQVSGSWNASANVSGYFNTGYWWRSTGSSSDLARFRANLPSAKKMVVEAWWPAASDRSSSAPFIIFDGNGNQLDTVYVNQKVNGGKWVQLGTYNFTAGWNEVALSRWTTPGDVVVADAVRFREVP